MGKIICWFLVFAIVKEINSGVYLLRLGTHSKVAAIGLALVK